jgi:hypothetical integral membrane protein (TIGR02206 family)
LHTIGKVQLFSPVHVCLVVAITVTAVVLAVMCRLGRISGTGMRLLLGCALAGNELIWWTYRYSHEGLKVSQNLPLQLCDLTVWMTVLACITLKPIAVEFAYFVGLAAAGMSVLTPDLWSPWPSYPAIYFFVGHGGIVIAVVMLVFGKIAVPRPGAVWRVFGLLVLYSLAIIAVNMIYDANYMYFCRRPANPSLLDLMGPWPIYILAAAPLSLALFCLLWLPIREKVYEIPDGDDQGVGSRESGVGSSVG